MTTGDRYFKCASDKREKLAGCTRVPVVGVGGFCFQSRCPRVVPNHCCWVQPQEFHIIPVGVSPVAMEWRGGGGWSWQDWTDAYVGRCCLRAVYLRRMKRLSLVPFTPQPFWNRFQFTSHLVKRVSLCGSHASKMPGTLPSYPSLFNPVFVLCHSKYLIETRRGMRQVADLKRLLSSTLHLRLHWFRLIQIETIKVTKTKWTSVPEMDSDSD